MLAELEALLDSAADERPIQYFFETNPGALIASTISPHMAWAFSRPTLPKPGGGSFVPDFMICDWSSIGPTWTIVELENPNFRVTKRDGISAQGIHAIQQVKDYRRHLKKYPQLVREGGFPGIHNPSDSLIVIGRRMHGLPIELNAERLAEYREERIEVASYDRLLERFRGLLEFRNEVRRTKNSN